MAFDGISYILHPGIFYQIGWNKNGLLMVNQTDDPDNTPDISTYPGIQQVIKGKFSAATEILVENGQLTMHPA